MHNIVVVTAADEKFKDLCTVCSNSSKELGYETRVYDLGGLGYGTPFVGRFSDVEGAKIPSKPSMILDVLKSVDNNDYVVWLDADAIIWDNIDEIKLQYDIGVTLRKPKGGMVDSPINAGVCFFRKTPATIKFMNTWIDACESGVSDQRELNRLLRGISPTDVNSTLTYDIDNTIVSVRTFPCDVYNSWWFKKPQMHAKITHYKSKYRRFWPTRTIKKFKDGTFESEFRFCD